MQHEVPAPHGEPKRVRGPRRDERTERKALLTRIAKGEYIWPEGHELPVSEPLRGAALAKSEGVRRVVGRLLVRNPAKRTRLVQLWDDEWMQGEGTPPVPTLPDGVAAADDKTAIAVPDDAGVESDGTAPEAWEDSVDSEDALWEPDEEDVEEGVLVDEHDIGPGSVARQEH
jgi:protein-serine/threonine kinase